MAVKSNLSTNKTVSDLLDCINALKEQFKEENNPITDDNVLLQKFFTKLEFILQQGLKEKTSILGNKKDYWDYLCHCLASRKSVHDGIRYVKLKSEVKTSLGKGRAFLRFCLVHSCLADSLQRCFIHDAATRDWYQESAFPLQKEKWPTLISILYDLSDVQFHLSPDCFDLDITWPTFSRQAYEQRFAWKPPSRSVSISSLNSQIQMEHPLGHPIGSDFPDLEEQDCSGQLLEGMRLELTQSELSRKELHKRVLDLESVETNLKIQIAQLQSSVENYHSIQQDKTDNIIDISRNGDITKINVDSVTCPDVSILTNLNSELQSQVTTFQVQIDELVLQKEHLLSVISESNSNNEKLKQENVQLVSELQSITNDNQVILIRQCEISQTIDQLQSRLQTSEDNLANTESAKNDMLKNLEEVQDQNRPLKEQIVNVTSKNEELKHEISRLNLELLMMSDLLRKSNQEIERFSKFVTDLEKKLASAYEQLETASKTIQSLEQKILDLNENSKEVILISKITDLEMLNIAQLQELESTSNNFQCKITSLFSEKDSLCQVIKKLEGDNEDLVNQLKEKNETFYKSNKNLTQLEHIGSVFGPLVVQQENVACELHHKLDNLCAASEKLSTDIKVLASILFCIAKKNFVTLDFLNESNTQPNKTQIPDKSSSELESTSTSLVSLVGNSARSVSKLKELYLKNDRVEMILQTCQNLCSDLIGLAREQKNKLALENFDLQGTQNVVDTLAKEHKKLRTAEAILRYELREKKKLLSTLRHQLESTREEWNRNRIKTAQSELEWHNLREEFASRHKESSEESGFSENDRLVEDTKSDHSDLSSTIEVAPEESVVDDNFQEASTSYAVPSPSPPSSSCEGAETSEIFAPPRSRLDILEEQYQLLYVSLSRSSKRSEVLEQRLEALLENADSFSSSSSTRTRNTTTLTNEAPIVAHSDSNLLESEDVLEPIAGDDLSQSDISFESGPDSDQALLCVTDSEESLNTVGSCNILSKDDEFPFSHSENMDENGNSETDRNESLVAAGDPPTDIRKKTLENFVIRMKDEKMARNAKEAVLRSQIQVLLAEKLELESKVLQLQQEKQQVWNKESEFRKRAEFIFRQERDSFESKVSSLNQERTQLIKAVEVLKSKIQENCNQLEEAKHTLQECRQELSEKEAISSQQVETLKFQMSVEAMKYERALKHYNEQELGIAEMKERVMSQELLIETLEESLREVKEERRAERERQWEDLEELQVSLSARDEECTAMNEELKKTTKELDETRNALGNLQTTSEETERELRSSVNRLKSALTQLKNDNEELKKQIIKLTKDKDVLWKRSEALSQLQFSPTRDRWMSDSEVTECLGCKSVFSFTLRKHHCRLCGRIFCHTCANHWVMMASSSHRTRICTECYCEHIEKTTNGQTPQLTTEQEGSEEEAVDAVAADAPKFIRAQPPTASSLDSSSVDSLPISQCCDSTSVMEALQEVNSNNGCEGDASNLEKTFLSENSNKMEFDVISDEEIARSLSGCSPYSPIPSPVSGQDTEMQTSCTRTIQDILLSGSEGASGEIWVNAGSSYGIPVLLDQADVILSWEFSSDPKSVAFSVVYKEESSEGTASEVLLQTTHVRSHLRPVQGHLIAKHSGLYILVFSNNFSRFIAKKVSYTLKIQNSDECSIPE